MKPFSLNRRFPQDRKAIAPLPSAWPPGRSRALSLSAGLSRSPSSFSPPIHQARPLKPKGFPAAALAQGLEISTPSFVFPLFFLLLCPPSPCSLLNTTSSSITRARNNAEHASNARAEGPWTRTRANRLARGRLVLAKEGRARSRSGAIPLEEAKELSLPFPSPPSSSPPSPGRPNKKNEKNPGEGREGQNETNKTHNSPLSPFHRARVRDNPPPSFSKTQGGGHASRLGNQPRALSARRP